MPLILGLGGRGAWKVGEKSISKDGEDGKSTVGD